MVTALTAFEGPSSREVPMESREVVTRRSFLGFCAASAVTAKTLILDAGAVSAQTTTPGGSLVLDAVAVQAGVLVLERVGIDLQLVTYTVDGDRLTPAQNLRLAPQDAFFPLCLGRDRSSVLVGGFDLRIEEIGTAGFEAPDGVELDDVPPGYQRSGSRTVTRTFVAPALLKVDGGALRRRTVRQPPGIRADRLMTLREVGESRSVFETAFSHDAQAPHALALSDGEEAALGGELAVSQVTSVGPTTVALARNEDQAVVLHASGSTWVTRDDMEPEPGQSIAVTTDGPVVATIQGDDVEVRRVGRSEGRQFRSRFVPATVTPIGELRSTLLAVAADGSRRLLPLE